MDIDLLLNWLQASLRLGAPLILVSIGEVYTERTGVLNIGIEGTMLTGALTAVAISYFTGNVFIAALGAMVIGGLIALGHAYLTVTRRANQVVSGAMINFFALGATNVMFARLFERERERVAVFPVLSSDGLREIPFLGQVLFSQPLIVWIAIILPFISAWVLYRTVWGLNIRAVGDHPQAVATAGLSVIKHKYLGVLMSGVFAGLGGCALTLSELGYFAPGGMTAGRGFIVLAAVIVGRWDPVRTAVICLFFGAADALQLRVQALGGIIPYQFLAMIPYLLTIAALAGLVGRTVPPKTWGLPYDPKEY